ncbi:MAG: glycosyltransferase [Desulfobulbaceae bacterium]|nr:glycosyltransferase [Desulfobulbaceae bacterium]
MNDAACQSVQKTKILHIGKFFPPVAGGIEYFLGDLLPALHKIDVNAATLVHAHAADETDDPQQHPWAVWRAPCYGNLLYTPISPSFPVRLSRIIRDFKPDLLHFHVPNVSAFWALTLPAAKRIPWVIHWHADVVASRIDRRMQLAYRFYRPFEQMLLSRSSTVIATSPPYLQTSSALEPWQDKSRVIPLGLDPARLEDPDDNLISWADRMWGDTKFRILTVGRLTYYKGHEVLIKAMQKLEDSRLLIIGEGEKRAGLEKQISSLGLADSVLLPGSQPEKKLNALLATCDCFCLPSVERTEAFGLVLLEAMRFGKPLVVSDIPGSGTGWVVRHEENGLLVRPGDTADLALALSEVKNNPEKRNQMSRTGLERFRENFHIDSVAARVKDVYYSVLSKENGMK